MAPPLFLLLLLIISPGLRAQQRQVVHEDQEGVRYLNQLRLDDRWTLSNDVGFRWRTGFQEASQYMVRTAAGYATGAGIKLTAFLSYMGYYREGAVASAEYRPAQEISVGQRIWGLNFRHRLRVEERFIRTRPDGHGRAVTDFYLRPRYALQLRLRLLRLSRAHPERQLLLTLGDEVLVQAGGGDDYGLTVRNRLLLSPAVELGPQLGISLTLTQQTAPTATPGVFRSSEVVWLVVRHRMGTPRPTS